MDIIGISQMVLAILLIAAILLQQRGSGLSGTFGGSDNTYSTRRGAEKIVFSGTIVVAFLFFGLSVVKLLL